jgi:orotidine-5'-phosphate decarboxylase
MEMKKSAKDYLIFPLDVASYDAAKSYIERLCCHVGMFKVGLELFIRSGPEIIRLIKSKGAAGIFLDLKLHDIPATVERAMHSIADLKVNLATVHCGENPGMLEAAVRGSNGRVAVLGVTLLTSVDCKDVARAGFEPKYAQDLTRLVLKRARMAKTAGCDGIVCSGLEVGALKSELGHNFQAVTPGIRPDWGETGADDQRRIMTPTRAVRAGSDYLVIGRPIRDAQDPVAAARRVIDEISALV